MNTYFILTGAQRWTHLLDGHELYCAGHLMEAAVAYYHATGKDKLLKSSTKISGSYRGRIWDITWKNPWISRPSRGGASVNTSFRSNRKYKIPAARPIFLFASAEPPPQYSERKQTNSAGIGQTALFNFSFIKPENLFWNRPS